MSFENNGKILEGSCKTVILQIEEVLTFADSDRAFRQAIDANES